MTNAERQVSRAIELIHADQTEEANGILSQMIKLEPKPILYWFAVARCSKDEDLSYSCLVTFARALEGTRAELQHVDGKTELDLLVEGQDELISLLSQEFAQKSDSWRQFQGGDYREAVKTLNKVIAGRIEAIKTLGYDVFSGLPQLDFSAGGIETHFPYT